MEVVELAPHGRCARFVAGVAEAFVTLDVGPRIIRYGRVGGPNLLFDAMGAVDIPNGTHYTFYGGHRLWWGPELWDYSYVPEDDPVEVVEEDGAHRFRSAVDRFGIQREIAIGVGDSGDLQVGHRLINRGQNTVEGCTWGLTVMAPGGVCLIPQEPFQPHNALLVPARTLSLWSYTNMQDERWTWGRRVIRLRQMADRPPQKCGASVSLGLAAYANGDNVFLKRFDFDPDATYTDGGCNFETFTNGDFLEVEALGPYGAILPGGAASHAETWYLLDNPGVPEDEDACGDWLSALAQTYRHTATR